MGEHIMGRGDSRSLVSGVQYGPPLFPSLGMLEHASTCFTWTDLLTFFAVLTIGGCLFACLLVDGGTGRVILDVASQAWWREHLHALMGRWDRDDRDLSRLAWLRELTGSTRSGS